jgi:MFS family permease
VDITARPPIFTRQVVLLFIAAFGAMTSFYLLLSVVPLYVVAGGAGDVGAGLATGAMMLATVLAELVVPWCLVRFGYRGVLGAGLVLLGGTAPVLLIGPALPLVLMVCLARGAGLAIVVVAGTALAAELIPAQRRGEGLGLYGVAVGVPAAIGLPVGLWLTEHVGFGSVFLVSAVVGVTMLLAVAGLPGAAADTSDGSTDQHSGGVLGGLRTTGVRRPTVIFTATTVAAGVLVTFLPLAAGSTEVAAVALLVQSCVSPLARWVAGRFGDRHGSGVLLLPASAVAAAGIAALFWIPDPVATIVGAVVFGIGFGVVQNVTLALMLERVPTAEFGRTSALWNLAYDAGMGIGAVGFGLIVAPIGYPASFAVTAAVLALALVPAWRDAVVRKER